MTAVGEGSSQTSRLEKIAERRKQLLEMGVDERFIADRSTHPDIVPSSWDLHQASGAVLLGQRYAYRFPHLAPQALLIVPISNMWQKDCWWRLQNAMRHTAQSGYSVSLHGVEDKNFAPADAIAMMRWKAAMMARDAGADKVLMIDTDVLLEEDTISKLMAWDRPVVFPMLNELSSEYPATIRPLSHPTGFAPNQGLVRVQWAAMSCMLFNPKIFNHLEPYAWRGDDYHFNQCLANMAHHIELDTNTVVNVTKGPRRDGSKTYDEKMESNRATHDEHQNQERDLGPPPGFDPAFDDGYIDEWGAYFAIVNPNGIPEQAKTENNGWHV